MTWDPWVVTGLLLCAAALYASVGHGGASAYLAVFALAGAEPASMRPTVLILNLGVAALATWRFVGAGHGSARLFWPLAAGGVPGALLGGFLPLSPKVYGGLLGVVLLCAAGQLLWRRSSVRPPEALRAMPPGPAVALGFALGFLSGMVGVGGGIFLSPLLVLGGWADLKKASGVSAPFIWVNSMAGLIGQAYHGFTLPAGWSIWVPAVMAGGLVGAELGSRRLSPAVLRWLLATVLAVASGKMLRLAAG